MGLDPDKRPGVRREKVKVIALFSVDEEKLLKESGHSAGEELAAFESECGWIEDSGIYLRDYSLTESETLEDVVAAVKTLKDFCRTNQFKEKTKETAEVCKQIGCSQCRRNICSGAYVES